MVQKDVLQPIESEDLAVYAVWEPILRTDDVRAARRSTTLLPDPRVADLWVDSQAVGRLFQTPIHLATEPAWDVYLVYPPGVEWIGDTPPAPVFFMHQLGGRLPDDLRLDGPKLAAAIREILPE